MKTIYSKDRQHKVTVINPTENLEVTMWCVRYAPIGTDPDAFKWSTCYRSEDKEQAIAMALSLAKAECNKGLELAVVPTGFVNEIKQNNQNK